jgi:predicted helicase
MVKINPDEFSLQVSSNTAHYGLPPRKARIHHHELWGSRAWKYDWLHANTLASTPWTRLKPSLPHLLLVPRDDSHLGEYVTFQSILHIMPQNGTGVKTHRDELVFNFTREALVHKLRLLLNTKSSIDSVRQTLFGDKASLGEYPLGDNRDWSLERSRQKLQNVNPASLIKSCLYRPFDNRFLAYSDDLIDWPRTEIMGNFIDGQKNLGLSLGRVGEATGSDTWDVCFITHCMTEFNLFRRGGNNLFPLWLTQTQGEPIANLSPRFLDALVASGIDPVYSPEDILAYLYAVLHAPSYRARYAEFLKSDFPRLPIAVCAASPLPFAAVWQALLPLGRELIALHLLKQSPDALQPHYPQSGNNGVEKPRYDEKTQRVYINATQYFDGLPPATWAFKVGGYQVCEKWLKDRKGRTLTLDDIEHYQKTVAALTRTQTLMQAVDAVVQGTLWPVSQN